MRGPGRVPGRARACCTATKLATQPARSVMGVMDTCAPRPAASALCSAHTLGDDAFCSYVCQQHLVLMALIRSMMALIKSNNLTIAKTPDTPMACRCSHANATH